MTEVDSHLKYLKVFFEKHFKNAISRKLKKSLRKQILKQNLQSLRVLGSTSNFVKYFLYPNYLKTLNKSIKNVISRKLKAFQQPNQETRAANPQNELGACKYRVGKFKFR